MINNNYESFVGGAATTTQVAAQVAQRRVGNPAHLVVGPAEALDWRQARAAFAAGVIDYPPKERTKSEPPLAKQQTRNKETMSKQEILLVDDNADFRSTVREFLELKGYGILEAGDAKTAKDIAESQELALIVIDIRLINNDDENDMSGLTLAKQLPAHLPKIILTAFPTYQAVREALGPALHEVPPAVGFIAKQEGLHSLLTAIRLALAQLPPTFKHHVLEAFQAPALVVLRERLNDLGVRDSVKYLQAAEAKTVDELAPQREAALRSAAQLHTFGLVARSFVLLLLTVTIALLLLDLTSAGTLSAIAGALAKCFDLWWGRQEEQARNRAVELHEELSKTKQGDHWLLMCEAFEDPQTRDKCREKVIEYVLSQRSD